MKVLFIRPKPSDETIGLQHLMIVEPLELEILATLIKEDHEVRIVDMIIERKDVEYYILEFNPDVVCVTGYITHIPRMIEYCTSAKKLNSRIYTVVGGVHVEKFPEDIDHQDIDFRVVRNATRSFKQLIDLLASGSSHDNHAGLLPLGVLGFRELLDESILPDYDFYLPVIDRSLTDRYKSKYFYVFHDKVALIKSSFGCPYKCKFCFCRVIAGNKYHARPLLEVMDELESIKQKEIYFVDDDFLVNANRTREFLRMLKERGINKKYLVYGRADFIAAHPDIIKEFKGLGLRTVIVGLESFIDQELGEFNKQTSSNINVRAMEVLNKNNVDCYAAVIISPSWTAFDFEKVGDIMLELGIKFVNLQPLTPLKGTGVLVKDEDLVIGRNEYAKWDLAHVSIQPEHMSLVDFYTNIMNLYLRIIRNPKNLLSHLKYPFRMQYKMAKGIYKVTEQYKVKINEIKASERKKEELKLTSK